MTTDIMQTPCPPVTIVAWCNTCEHYFDLDQAQPGQRCPVGDPDCYSVLVKRRALICELSGECSDVKMALLVPSRGQSPREVWWEHLMAEHDDIPLWDSFTDGVNLEIGQV